MCVCVCGTAIVSLNNATAPPYTICFIYSKATS